MIIIKVKKPLQDKFTRDEDVELIDGEKKFWFTNTSLYTDNQGGYEKFLLDISLRVKSKGHKGIYLYQVGTYERPVDFRSKEMETVHFISWDFYD